ncbi:MAG: branched-chain amino acid ABC transporter permease [Desulfatiglans sp.]|jgi:branched-chain amino acid transport system permease protein|nr:branched-chain amino acid ABC transporter permease [Thermodesulfobacteriota bacterium]MEE4351743.1 branched-chain amino acid ABC transporter permease [Desulfatiglans sp.]
MSLPCGVYNETYTKDFALARTKTHWGLLIGWVVLVMALPLFIGPTLMSWLTLVGITAFSSLGLHIITGLCGQMSIGHTAFMAVGAFTYANLAKYGLHWIFAIIVSGIYGALVGTLFGLPSLKVKELYLALTTLAAQFIIPWVLLEYFGGGFGVVPPDPEIFGIVLKKHYHFYYLAWIFTLVFTYFVFNLGRTKMGRAYKAIRDHDLAAEAMGINVGLYKVSSFTLGCFIAGIAGALLVIWIGRADVEHFTIMESIWYLAFIIVGGAGSVAGVFFGVLFIRGLWELSVILSGVLIEGFPALPESLTSAVPTILVAGVIIVFVILEPRGLNHRWAIFKESYRLWPWSYW